ncbi:MAG: ATP-dependent DNA helicase RecG [Clostridiales bacterium]|jgi:ATP-dependent DNA helicase RecG|nr:ATP-dependent DNA helicase RecG [Clostridiales bacterium]
MHLKLSDPMTALHSVGEARAALFHKIGIFTVQDLLGHFPRDYDDRSLVKKISELVPGIPQTFRGCISGAPEISFSGKRSIAKAFVKDETGTLSLVWFNQPYLKGSLKASQEYVFTGTPTLKSLKGHGRMLEMASPDFEAFSENMLSAGRIVPIYKSTYKLSQKLLRGFIKAALERCGPLADDLWKCAVISLGLLSRDEAVRNIHFPQSEEAFMKARLRLVFEELFFMQLALLSLKDGLKKPSSFIMSASPEKLLASLPFELTGAQARAIDEIRSDLNSGSLMNRLVQGDVGSGKTAAAMAASFIAIESGRQAAIMAPTETLARQHHESFSKAFEPLGIETFFLAGSQAAAEKRRSLDAIRSGEAQMIVGTHALIQRDVFYRNLGLVITDEQHRFGVNQRFNLQQKGESVHTLVMTATPIPRTLALILYGDLDISIIDEMPPGRQPVDTFHVTSAYRQRIWAFIKKELEKGNQAYIVCPAIEEGEKGCATLQSVEKYYEDLKLFLHPFTLRRLHGKLKQTEKDEIMGGFKSNRIHAIVATTVIEVGINVPNATIMLVENAERFGLAQLHQLRGRVGRGKDKSYCVMISDAAGKASKERLDAMTKSNDGFYLSEMDLKLRGPGDFFGASQHGIPEFKIANLYQDLDILKLAQEFAIKAKEEGGFGADGQILRLLESSVADAGIVL